VQGTLSDTDGGGVNGGGNLMLNLPIGDTLSARFVATDTYRSGWLNRLELNPFPEDAGTEMGRGNVLAAPVAHVFKDVNTEHLDGGRITVLFKPNDDFNVVTTVLFQHMGMGGYDEFDNPPGPAYDALYEPGNQGETVDDWFHFYSVEATLNVGFADLTSTSGYFQRHELQTQDASESISFFAGIYPYVNEPFSEVDITRQFSQELRLTSRGDGPLHWVGGLFFSDDSSDWDEYAITTNPLFDGANFGDPASLNGDIYNGDQYYRVRQTAGFVDGSYNLTDQWKFSTGVRYYHYSSTTIVFGQGIFAPTPTGSTFTQSVSSSGVNPRFNLSYSPNADLNTYVSASKGYRPGGPSYGPFPALNCDSFFPPKYKSDSIWDYEIGEKAKLFDNWLTVNSDFYYIKWSNVQETIPVPCGYTYEANAGNARSYGPELEVNAKLSPNWSVAASASYTNAEINHPTANFIAAILANPVPGGIAGCESTSHCSSIPILNVPKDAASLSVIYTQPVLDNYTLTARITDNFTGHAYDQAYSFGIGLPSYNLASARLGLSGDKWTATLFVDNFTNKLAELTTNNTQFQFNIPQLTRISTNQPRTFGTEVNYKF
jgi:outer membrane receptor protein involved in Fe transport